MIPGLSRDMAIEDSPYVSAIATRNASGHATHEESKNLARQISGVDFYH